MIRTGEPELYPEVPEELLLENAIDDEHLRIIRELGIVSAMIVPLKARGNVLGAMTLVASSPGAVTTTPTSSSPRSSRAAPRSRSTTRCCSAASTRPR